MIRNLGENRAKPDLGRKSREKGRGYCCASAYQISSVLCPTDTMSAASSCLEVSLAIHSPGSDSPATILGIRYMLALFASAKVPI
jgi:hypothetical protein